MAAELAAEVLSIGPASEWREVRILRHFRTARERLREVGKAGDLLDEVQYARAGAAAGVDVAEVRAVVEKWIYQRPLKYLGWVRRRGCRKALEALAARGIKVGVFSDYPTTAKVGALGLTDVVSLQLCATDRSVNAFKPHPAGFLEACRRWDIPPHRVAYVGDRLDVDVQGALAAGMHPIVIGSRTGDGFTGLGSFGALERLLVDQHA